MSLLRWDPFAELAQMREQVNRVFEQGLTRAGREPAAMHTWAPAVDIVETADAMVLQVELPGITPGEIDIQMAGDTLTIKGERKFARDTDGREYMRIERNYGAFQRSFTLALPVDHSKVTATYTNGVLEITLPKQEEVKPKQVKVEVKAPETIEVA